MSTQVQLRGGSTSDHSTFTGAAREVTVDTTKNVVVVHDGSTAGGVPLATEAAVSLKAPLASPTLTGTPLAPTAAGGTNTTQIATTAFVAAAVSAAVAGLLNFKGATDCSGTPNYPSAVKGDAYIVSVAGKIGGASGTSVDVGDWYVATADNAGGTEASVGASWGHLEHNLVGALLASNNLSDLVNAGTARTNLGLGALAVLSSLAFTDLTSHPTTLSGYGITDSVLITGGALGTPLSGTLTNCTGLPEGGLSTSDITTNNVSTSKHGFAPKLPNDATKFLDGTGAYSTPAGGTGVSLAMAIALG